MIENDATAIGGRRGAKLRLREARTKARLPRPALQIAGVHSLLVEIQISVDDVVLLIREAGRDRLHRADRNLGDHSVRVYGRVFGCDRNQLCLRTGDRKLRQKIFHLLTDSESVQRLETCGCGSQRRRGRGLLSEVVQLIGAIKKQFMFENCPAGFAANAVEVIAPLVRRCPRGNGCLFLVISRVVHAIQVIQPGPEVNLIRAGLGDDVELSAGAATIFRAVHVLVYHQLLHGVGNHLLCGSRHRRVIVVRTVNRETVLPSPQSAHRTARSGGSP